MFLPYPPNRNITAANFRPANRSIQFRRGLLEFRKFLQTKACISQPRVMVRMEVSV